MAYFLTGVKPWVKTAGNYLGPKYGIKTIYGLGPGSVPNSDHPKGLALDFMINNIANGRSVGDSLAADVLANMASYSVTYLIWYKRENNGQGWKSYHGPSDHTDHVHVSFQKTQTGSGVTAETVSTSTGVPNPTDFTEAWHALQGLAAHLTDAKFWTRVGIGAGAVVLLFAGAGFVRHMGDDNG